jgi:hypothetical protein
MNEEKTHFGEKVIINEITRELEIPNGNNPFRTPG